MPKKKESEDFNIEIEELPVTLDNVSEPELIELLSDEEANERQNEKIASEALKAPKVKNAKKPKPVITYKPLKNEKCIRIKYKDGKFHSYEVTVTFKRETVFDEDKNSHVKKQVQQRKTFSNKEDAIKWRNEMQTNKIEAKQRNREYKKYGATVIEAAEAYYASVQRLVEEGKRTESYLNQLRIQTDHFRRYFNGEGKTYVKHIDVQQIEDYFSFEENKPGRGASRASIAKYKCHLKAIWDFMLKDKAKYGIFENVVVPAQITTPKTEYKAAALSYEELNELIIDACKLEDPTFLYLVVMSMTQGLRRGELCGLMWKDIDFKTNQVTICHNRVQLVTKDTTKLPKREKIRTIELHKAGRETLLLYKDWQESILGRKVKPDEFVMQWEINLLQNYVCHTGKVSRRWKEIYGQINKSREKAKKDTIPYGRIHDGRHTYITLSLQGVKKDDGTIVPPASYFQVFQSAGHSLPKNMSNTSTTVYNEDVGARWDVTRFWNDVIYVDISATWNTFEQIRKFEYDQMTEFQKDRAKSQKQARLEKAREERLKSNPPQDVVVDYE